MTKQAVVCYQNYSNTITVLTTLLSTQLYRLWDASGLI